MSQIEPPPGAVEREAPVVETERRPIALRATEKQKKFIGDVLSGRWRYMATGGAIRGTKTYMTIMALFILCRVYPRSRWAIVRQDLPTLRRNTLPSFEKIRATTNDWIAPLNQSTWTYEAKNGSQILIFPESIQNDPDLDRWKGMEVNGYLLEEANELQRKSFSKSIERAGSWIIPQTQDEIVQQAAIESQLLRMGVDPDRLSAHGPWPDDLDAAARALLAERALVIPRQPPPLILLTFNPADNWVRDDFYDPWEAGTLKEPWYFLPTTIFDNPFVTQEYLDSLKNLPTEEYERFVLGKWGAIRRPNRVIEPSWITAARETPFRDGPMKEAVDVARFGDDKTVFARVQGNRLVEIEAQQGWDTVQTATRAGMRIMSARLTSSGIDTRRHYVVDTIGVGGGVADQLRAADFPVQDFVAGAKPMPRPLAEDTFSLYKFADLRSQAWWEFREKLQRGEVLLDIALEPDLWRQIIKELAAPNYEFRSDRTIKVEAKEEVKKRIGVSTDHADAIIMAFFDYPDYGDDDLSTDLPPTTSYVSYR